MREYKQYKTTKTMKVHYGIYHSIMTIIAISASLIILFATAAPSMTIMTEDELMSTSCGSITQSAETKIEVSTRSYRDSLSGRDSATDYGITETNQNDSKKEADSFIIPASHSTGISIGFYNISLDIYIDCITYGDKN